MMKSGDITSSVSLHKNYQQTSQYILIPIMPAVYK